MKVETKSTYLNKILVFTLSDDESIDISNVRDAFDKGRLVMWEGSIYKVINTYLIHEVNNSNVTIYRVILKPQDFTYIDREYDYNRDLKDVPDFTKYINLDNDKISTKVKIKKYTFNLFDEPSKTFSDVYKKALIKLHEVKKKRWFK